MAGLAERAISRGTLRAIFENDQANIVEHPVFQCLQVKPLQGKDGQDRYRLILSDVNNFVQSMLATNQNDLVSNGVLKKHSILKVNAYTSQEVKEKKILIIVDCEVLSEYGEPERIGAPQDYPKLADGQTPAQQPGNVSANGFYGNGNGSARPTASVKQEETTQRSLPQRSNGLDSSYANIYPIEALSPYAHRWTIRARITNKSEMRQYRNANGEGRLFSINLLDESGEIRATVFHSMGEQFDSLYEMIKEGGVYYISSPCQVKMANKRFSQLNNDYELVFERDTRVEKVEDQSMVPQVRYNFTRIGDLESIEANTTIDTIGILKEVGELNQITSKTTSKPYEKRDLTLVDDTLHQVRLTVWGKQATNFDAPVESVLAFKGVKVSDFNGKSLSLLSSGAMSVDPDIDDAHKLKGWYDAQGRNDTFTTHAAAAGVTAGPRKDAYKTIVEVKDVLGLDPDKPEYFNMKATIVYIKQDNLYYPACQSENCNKKVIEIEPGSWRCESCDKSFPKPQYRYIMSINVQDHTGQMWLSAFDDTGRAVLGKTADELNDIKEGDNPGLAQTIFEEANCKAYIFRCRAKMDTFREEQRPRYQIQSATPPNYKAEAAKLAELISQYDLNSDSLFVN